MSRLGGTRRGLARGLAGGLVVLAAMATAGCAQAEPDERLIAQLVGEQPGVLSVDASFTGTSLGNGGDQSLEVRMASRPDPRHVEDLVRALPGLTKEVEHGEGYDEFVIETEPGEANDGDRTGPSTFGFGREPVEASLTTRWATAVAASPPGGLAVRAHSGTRPTTASVSSRRPLPESLTWALGSGLTDLDWTLIQYQTDSSPYVRFAPDQPLVASMVDDWNAIEATYAGRDGSASIARVVVVEDVKGIRKVRVAVSFPTVIGPITETTHGEKIWPIVSAIDDVMPEGHRLDLELNRAERREQSGGKGDGDLVDRGTGSADWEAAYRQRFPDALTPTATPT